MIQELYQKAIKYAGDKHSKQLVPGTNSNYLLHIANVAMEVLVAYSHSESFDIAYAIQVAILHDTIEDTSSTYEEIKELFGEDIANGVQALTKNENLSTKEEMMLDSLRRINEQLDEVGLVKLADRITNLQHPPPHWSQEKVKKYLNEAKLISKSLQNKNEYLSDRIERKIVGYGKFVLS